MHNIEADTVSGSCTFSIIKRKWVIHIAWSRSKCFGLGLELWICVPLDRGTVYAHETRRLQCREAKRPRITRCYIALAAVDA